MTRVDILPKKPNSFPLLNQKYANFFPVFDANIDANALNIIIWRKAPENFQIFVENIIKSMKICQREGKIGRKIEQKQENYLQKTVQKF